MKVVLGCRFYSNQSDDDNSGKLIQLVVTSLRVDRVAASGLGIARRWNKFFYFFTL
jgi:RNA-binding protein YlmH